MPYLLDLVYLSLLIVVSPWLAWSAFRKGKYRAGYAEKLLGLVPRRKGTGACIWFHAVSVGEVNLLQPLLQRLQSQRPDLELVLSTTTRTGYETAARRYPELTRFYCPLDFSWAVRAALRRVQPDLLVLAELELWPNLVQAAKQRGTRVAVVNGRLSERSARGYRRVAWLVRSLLRRLDLLAVQSPEYAKRFLGLGASPERVHVTGSMKFDGAISDRANSRSTRLAQLAGLRAEDLVFLAGSTQHPEEELAIEAYRALERQFPALRLIIVPRHPERFEEVAERLDRSGLAWERRSHLPETGGSRTRVLLVDTIGELAAWWGVAHIGYVGGSMGSRGGQSMIEPAAYGVAVSFGPRTHNFRDVVRLLLDRQAAAVVRDGQELTSFVRACLQDADYRQRLGQRAQQLVASQLGATEHTLDLLCDLLPAAGAARRAA